MKLMQVSHNLFHPGKSKTWELRDLFHTVLAGVIGAVFGLLMGMTALIAFLGSKAASEAGKPGMLLIKVIVVGTFVILSVILFTREAEEEDKEADN